MTSLVQEDVIIMAYEDPRRPPEPLPEPERPPTEVIVSRRDRPIGPVPEPDESEEVRVYNGPGYPGRPVPPDYAYTTRMDRLRRERALARANTIGKSIEGVWLIVGILEALLAMRFIFEIAGAHVTSGFIQFLYGVTGPFVLPFDSIFPIGRFGPYVFDPNILVGMAIWALLGVLITRLLAFSVEPPYRP